MRAGYKFADIMNVVYYFASLKGLVNFWKKKKKERVKLTIFF